MHRAMLPPYCPGCGEAVPRAAASRCPLCRKPFRPAIAGQPRPAPRPPRPLAERHRDDEG